MAVSFHLFVDSIVLTPPEMCLRLGPMDKSWNAGDVMPNGKLRDANRWQITERFDGPFSTDMVDQALDALLARIAGREDDLAEIASGGYACLTLCVMSDGYPGFGLTPKQLTLISWLGVHLDLDLYCEERHS